MVKSDSANLFGQLKLFKFCLGSFLNRCIQCPQRKWNMASRVRAPLRQPSGARLPAIDPLFAHRPAASLLKGLPLGPTISPAETAFGGQFVQVACCLCLKSVCHLGSKMIRWQRYQMCLQLSNFINQHHWNHLSATDPCHFHVDTSALGYILEYLSSYFPTRYGQIEDHLNVLPGKCKVQHCIAM